MQHFALVTAVDETESAKLANACRSVGSSLDFGCDRYHLHDRHPEPVTGYLLSRISPGICSKGVWKYVFPRWPTLVIFRALVLIYDFKSLLHLDICGAHKGIKRIRLNIRLPGGPELANYRIWGVGLWQLSFAFVMLEWLLLLAFRLIKMPTARSHTSKAILIRGHGRHSGHRNSLLLVMLLEPRYRPRLVTSTSCGVEE